MNTELEQRKKRIRSLLTEALKLMHANEDQLRAEDIEVHLPNNGGAVFFLHGDELGGRFKATVSTDDDDEEDRLKARSLEIQRGDFQRLLREIEDVALRA